MKLLILGGYGVFGGRLARLLVDLNGLDIVIAGRSAVKAQAFVNDVQGAAILSAVALDRNEIATSLPGIMPDLLVDASGPFQAYGDDPYGVVKACLGIGCHYLDLADGAEFVAGIGQFDAEAKARGLIVRSGLSTCPALTSAVVSAFEREMTVTSLAGGIAPSPRAGVGETVLRAVLGYAGQDLDLMRDGRMTSAKALVERRRMTIAPPGKLPLHNKPFSLVEVPDLRLLPKTRPDLRDIWFGAGVVPEVFQRLLNFLARARATIGGPDLTGLAPVAHKVLSLFAIGEHRGGMIMVAEGLRGGQPVTMSWHLVAEGDDGPNIPALASEVMIRRIKAGDLPEAGARPAIGDVTLAEFETAFAHHAITTGFHREPPAQATLFQQLMGSAFDDLPLSLQRFHGQSGKTTWTGRADVIGSGNPLAKMISRIFRFPAPGKDQPLTVTVSPYKDGERWVRTYGTRSMVSTLRPGVGRSDRLIVERFGPVAVHMALVVEDERLQLVPRRMTIFGVPLPARLLPGDLCFEQDRAGVFGFDVTLSLPGVGRIVTYRGTLAQR